MFENRPCLSDLMLSIYGARSNKCIRIVFGRELQKPLVIHGCLVCIAGPHMAVSRKSIYVVMSVWLSSSPVYQTGSCLMVATTVLIEGLQCIHGKRHGVEGA